MGPLRVSRVEYPVIGPGTPAFFKYGGNGRYVLLFTGDASSSVPDSDQREDACNACRADAGVSQYIVKPFNANQLEEKIKAIFK